MEELKQYLSELLTEQLYQIIISNPRQKGGVFKVKIRPILLRKNLCFQETRYLGTQVFHENYAAAQMVDRILFLIKTEFKQLEAESSKGKLTAMVSKKGKVTLKYNASDKVAATKMTYLSHNRSKKYILEEGKPVPFLIDLGVQTTDGKIIHARYDKFKQINRYLEFVEDVLPVLMKEKPIHIIDFGCGKSYLTFALYYYLHELKGLEVMITGLDLKEEVITHCSILAEKYGYDNLHFCMGDISTFQGASKVDMVVTLHACDTATDYAIYKAISWRARVIFSVPCCQHEVNRQLKNEILEPVLKYGLLKERMAALITDGIRANLLEEVGYETQVLEFIDMEHTPKNILIRAVKRKERDFEASTGIQELTDALQVNNTLQKLISENWRSKN